MSDPTEPRGQFSWEQVSRSGFSRFPPGLYWDAMRANPRRFWRSMHRQQRITKRPAFGAAFLGNIWPSPPDRPLRRLLRVELGQALGPAPTVVT